MKILCLFFIVVSVVLAVLNEQLKVSAIAYLMGISWGVLAGCFMGPFVLGLLWKKVTRPAVWGSIIGSLVLTAVLLIVFGYDQNGWACSFGIALKSGMNCSPMIGVICMLYSLLVTAVVSLFTKAPDAETVENAFKTQENEVETA